MGDLSTPFRGGEELTLSARFMNAVRDTVLAKKRTERPIRDMPSESFRQADIIKIKNESGSDRDRFDVLGISGLLYGPTDNLKEFKNRPNLKGTTPSLAYHRGRFAVLLEPVRSGKIGRAWVSGVCPARVEIVDPSHMYCDILDSDATKLRSTATGSASILYPGSGDEWAVIRFGNREGVRLCKTTELWAVGTVATLDVWENGTTPSETITTGETIEATNHLWDVDENTFCYVMFGGAGANYLVNARPDSISCS